MSDLRFTEKICSDNVDYLLSLEDDVLISTIYNKNELDKHGKVPDVKVYIKNVKTFLNKMKKHYFKLERKYKYGRSLNKGRQYIKDGYGIQNLQSQIRAFLTQDYYNDYDMSNCQPSILNYIVKKYFSDHPFPKLDEYCNNREEIIKEDRKKLKDTIISAMNSNKFIKTDNVFIKALDYEFKNIQTLFFESNNEEFNKLCTQTGLNTNNKKGSYLNKILCIYENEILMECVKLIGSENIGCLIFDGFLVNKNKDRDEILKVLNDHCNEKYNIKWTEKPMETNIEIEDDWTKPPELDEFEIELLLSDENLSSIFLKEYETNLVYKDNELYIFLNNKWFIDDKRERIEKQILDILIKYVKDKYDYYNKRSDNTNAKIYINMLKTINKSSKITSIRKTVINKLSVINFEKIEFDKNPDLFVFNNIAYDLVTHTTRQLNKDDYILTRLDYDLENRNEEKINKLSEIINDILIDDDIKSNMIQLLSTGLYGRKIINFTIANGCGSNGKTSLFELMRTMLVKGIYCYIASPSILNQDISNKNNPEIASVNNMRMVIMSEPSSEKKLNLAIIKKLTGENQLGARMNHSNSMIVNNTATYILQANDVPKLDGNADDNATKRRITDIPFKSTFTTDETILDENKDDKYTIKANPYYETEEFYTEYKCSLFYYLIDFIKKYEKDNNKKVYEKVELCDEVRSRTDNYIKSSNEINNYISEKYEKTENENDYMKIKDLYLEITMSEFYKNYSREEKRAFTITHFINYIKKSMTFKKYFYSRKMINSKHLRNVITNYKQSEIADEDEE